MVHAPHGPDGHRHHDGHGNDREYEPHGHAHHGHSHAGHHHHPPAQLGLACGVGIVLNFGFVLAEIVYGLLAGSIALVADAGHNLADVLGLVMVWVTAYLARRHPTQRHTYGWRRSSILAALANAVLLLIGVGGIAVEAIHRLVDPSPVVTGIMIWVAAIGILVNGGTAVLFLPGRKDDINIKAAFAHMAGDALVSVGVVAAGVAIDLTGRAWLDPATGLVIAGLITFGTWGLLRESLNLALDGVPAEIDPDAVARYLRHLPGVSEVHDLHIWAMSTTETALTAHLVRPEAALDDALLATARTELKQRFAIAHATFQIESGEAHCELASGEVV